MARGSRATIALTYHGVPARGVVFGRRSVYTSYFACDWMFCTQDRPGDKATMNLTLMLAKGMTSLGIGTLQSIAPASPGVEAHAWREERPYSSYVYGFAAGALHVASERQGPLELRYLSEDASQERLSALFASTGRMVRFFEEKAGVPIPHSRYTQVLVAGSAAQEAATFSVVGEEEVSPILEHPQEDWVIAHELAHQWWGNLVTCTEWSEFWLNEGITTFMVAAWKEHAWGRAAYDREMELARRRLETANKAAIDVPLTYRGAYPSLSLRRAIQYSKGALFMDRLRQELGDDAFWPALRSFTRAHAGKTVESRDLQRAFELAARRDLADLFKEWVY
jgi:aminopeptidase N